MDWGDVIGILVLLGPGAILAQKIRKSKKDGRDVSKVLKYMVIAYYVVLFVVIGPVMLEALLMAFLGG